jgi:transcriptional regulator with XRE-family HTH domain
MATKKPLRTSKSLYRPENRVFLEVLRDIRERAGMTQIDLGLRLGRTQNYVSTAERGAVRLDGLQLRDWCQACGTDLVSWAREIESQLSTSGKLSGIKRKQT